MKTAKEPLAAARAAAEKTFAPGSEDHRRVMAGLASAGHVLDGSADPASYRSHQVRVPATVDVKAIRAKTSLTQAAFAERYGFAVGSVRDWEQERSVPERSNRLLLTIIERRPDILDDLLTS